VCAAQPGRQLDEANAFMEKRIQKQFAILFKAGGGQKPESRAHQAVPQTQVPNPKTETQPVLF